MRSPSPAPSCLPSSSPGAGQELPFAEHPTLMVTSSRMHLSAGGWGHPPLRYVRTRLNPTGFNRTKRLYWTDVLVDWWSERHGPLHRPSQGQNHCKELTPLKGGHLMDGHSQTGQATVPQSWGSSETMHNHQDPGCGSTSPKPAAWCPEGKDGTSGHCGWQTARA